MAYPFRSEHYDDLQELVDFLYKDKPRNHRIDRLDAILGAEVFDVIPELMEVVESLPAGYYTRSQMCAKLNSTISGHGWGYTYGTVE